MSDYHAGTIRQHLRVLKRCEVRYVSQKRGRGRFCTRICLYEKISTQVYFACSPEFVVGNFAMTCCEPAFGKARLAILKCCSLLIYGNFARNVVVS